MTTWRKRWLAAASGLAAAVWLSACATGGTSSRAEPRSSPAERPTRIEVDNGNTADVVIYALSQGQYYRLGEVTAHQRSTITLPRHLGQVTNLRLVADPVGSRSAFLSESILFSPGDRIVLSVGPRMNLSSVSVRSGSP